MRILALWFLVTGLALARPYRVELGAEVRPLPSGFIGFSMEKTQMFGPHLRVGQHALLPFCRLLGPGSLRLGGNSVDELKRAPSDEEISETVKFARAAGWRLIYCLNLGANNAQAAAQEARRIWKMGKDCLIAFEIGNEPDLYETQKLRRQGWDGSAFRQQFRAYRKQLGTLPVSGPGVGVIFTSLSWVTPFLAQEGKGLAFASVHFYPTVAKTPFPEDSPLNPTAENLLSPATVEYLQDTFFRPLIAQARTQGLTLRVTEGNSAARGGQPGVSDAPVSALWVCDWTLRLLVLGADGFNVQTDASTPNDVYTPLLKDGQGYQVRPVFYGMLLAAQFRSGTLLGTSVEPAASALTVYANRGQSLQIVLINRDLHEPAEVTLAGRRWRGRTLSLLEGSNGLELGQAKVSPEGRWEPRYQSVDSEVLTLPPASAMLFEFHAR